MKLNQFTKIAVDAAYEAGAILETYYNKQKIRIQYKAKIDPVSSADKDSESIILKKLLKHFPEHSVLSEEQINEIQNNSKYCWIIDPLDGTVNFIHKVPFFSISIGLMYNNKIILGVVYAPLLKEFFVAQKDAGVWYNGKKIKVSNIKKLVKSLVVTGFPYNFHDKPEGVINKLSKVTLKVQGVRRLGSAALDLAYVAMGRFDAFWEEGLYPWDVAAGSLIVQEAGGMVTEFNNKNNFIFNRSIIASNGYIHKYMVKLINDRE